MLRTLESCPPNPSSRNFVSLQGKEKLNIVSGAASPRRFPAGVFRRRAGRGGDLHIAISYFVRRGGFEPYRFSPQVWIFSSSFRLENISNWLRIRPTLRGSGARRGVHKVCSAICAPGRIRTYVATRAIGLQPIAIDRSATDAKCYSTHNIQPTNNNIP